MLLLLVPQLHTKRLEEGVSCNCCLKRSRTSLAETNVAEAENAGNQAVESDINEILDSVDLLTKPSS
jgi:hypothetical protein